MADDDTISRIIERARAIRGRKRGDSGRRGPSIAPGLVLGAGGAATAAASNGMQNLFEEAGFSRTPKFDRDVVDSVRRFGRSFDGMPTWADYLYNYAQTGHDAIKKPVIVGSKNMNSAQDLYQVFGLASKKMYPRFMDFRGSRLGRSISRTSFGRKVMDGTRKLLLNTLVNGGYGPRLAPMDTAIEHYGSFADNPITAYMKMIHEYRPGAKTTVGDLADSVIDAFKNYNNPSNLAKRSFSTPEEYFSWKMRDVTGTQTSVPVRGDFAKDKWYRKALKAWRKSDKKPVFGEFMEAAAPYAGNRNKLLEVLSGTGMGGEAAARKNLIQAFVDQVGDLPKVTIAPDRKTYSVESPVTKWRSLSDLRAHRSLLQKFLDTARGTTNLRAERNYGRQLPVALVARALASNKTKYAGILAALLGTGSAAYAASRKISEGRSRRRG